LLKKAFDISKCNLPEAEIQNTAQTVTTFFTNVANQFNMNQSKHMKD